MYEQFLQSFKDNESTILLLVDNVSGFQKLQIETWFDDVVNKKRGIWLGSGLAEQAVIDTPRLEPEVKQLEFDDEDDDFEEYEQPVKKTRKVMKSTYDEQDDDDDFAISRKPKP